MLTLDATSLSRDERALLQRFADRLIEHWERADYEAWRASDTDAAAIVALAQRFIAAVEAMFA